MPHVTINAEGAIVYRTKLFPSFIAARAFARCLRGNATRFMQVAVCEGRAGNGKYYVEFSPVSRERQTALYQSQLDARQSRADAEGGDYIFWRDPDHPGIHWCFNPLGGETYQVGAFSCTCPDWVYRCNRAGLLCKHQLAFRTEKEAGTLGQTDKYTPGTTAGEEKATSLAERFAEAGLEPDRDFA